MVCKNKVHTSKTSIDKNTGSKVMTYTTTRQCSNNIQAIQQEENNDNTDNTEEEVLLGEPDNNNEEKEVMTLQEVKVIFDRFMKKL